MEKTILEQRLLEIHVDPTPYVKVDTAANIFNRLVIWDAKLIHAAPTYFGHNIDTARLTQVFFFDTEK